MIYDVSLTNYEMLESVQMSPWKFFGGRERTKMDDRRFLKPNCPTTILTRNVVLRVVQP